MLVCSRVYNRIGCWKSSECM